MEISLRHTGGARFTAEARHHRVLLDQPAEDGATDQGMSPAELLLASLGGCVGQYVAQYLSLRGLSSEGLRIRVETQPSPRILHLGDFQVDRDRPRPQRPPIARSREVVPRRPGTERHSP